MKNDEGPRAPPPRRLGEQALVINNELDQQRQLLEQLDEDVDRQAEKLNFVMKHMAKVTHQEYGRRPS